MNKQLAELIHRYKTKMRFDPGTAKDLFELNDRINPSQDVDELERKIKKRINEGSLPNELGKVIDLGPDPV